MRGGFGLQNGLQSLHLLRNALGNPVPQERLGHEAPWGVETKPLGVNHMGGLAIDGHFDGHRRARDAAQIDWRAPDTN